jgi:hypothetical protein
MSCLHDLQSVHFSFCRNAMWNKTSNFRLELTKVSKIFRLFGLQYFTLTDESKVNHRGSETSKKFKLNFCLVLAVAFVSTAFKTVCYKLKRQHQMSESLLNENTESGALVEEINKLITVCLLFSSLTHAYCTTSTAKRIFKLCEDINDVFQNNLNLEVDYTRFSSHFKKVLFCSVGLLSTSTLMMAIVTYLDDELNLLFLLLDFSSYFFMFINLLRLVFFVMLVNFNFQNVSRCLKQVENLNQSSSFIGVGLRLKSFALLNEKDSTSKVFVSLKRIHKNLWDMTELINQVSGPSISILTILSILGNTLGGYRIFLYTKGEVNLVEACRKFQ